MGTVVRCCLVIIAVALWLMFSIAEGSLSSSRNRNQGITVNRWYDTFGGLSETPYSECSQTNRNIVGRVTKVEVEGCDGDRCELHRGTSATINISFFTDVNVTSIQAEVHGVIGVLKFPFHLPNPNGCQKSGLTCPIGPGQEHHYTTSIAVLNGYPRIDVTVQWELVTQNGDDILCILIPSRIV